jgi:hypothetical protein
MMRVIKYYDLRPVDWASGKRLPLEAGAGHVCDRCGAEHSVVYVVEDTVAGKTYSVGSTCARAQFGFDTDVEARDLIKISRQQAASELDQLRQSMVEASVPEIDLALSKVPTPDFISDRERYPGITCWRCGDSMALAAHGRTDQEARAVAFQGWVQARIREAIPPEWYQIEILLDPRSRSKTKISMGRKAEMLALAYLRSH